MSLVYNSSKGKGRAQMKLATYRRGGEARVGIVDADKGLLFDLAAAARRDGVPDAPLRLDAGPHRRRRRRARFGAIARGETRRRGRPVDRSGNDGIARALARAATDARRDVVRTAHPPVRARGAGGSGAPGGRPRGVQGGDGGAARRSSGGLPRAADLLHHQSVHGRRTRRDGEVAALQRGDGLRARGRHRHTAHAIEHSR